MFRLILGFLLSGLAFASCPQELVRQLAEFYVESVQGTETSLVLGSLLSSEYEKKLKEVVARHRGASEEAVHQQVLELLQSRLLVLPRARSVTPSEGISKPFERVVWFGSEGENPSIAASPDGMFVALSVGKILEIYTPEFKNHIGPRAFEYPVDGVQFSNNGHHIVMENSNGLALVGVSMLEIQATYFSNRSVPSLTGGTSQSPDGDYFVGTNRTYGTLGFINLKKKTDASATVLFSNPAQHACPSAFFWGSKRFIVQGELHEFTLFEVNRNGSPQKIKTFATPFESVALQILPSQKSFLALSTQGELTEISTKTFKPIRALEAHPAFFRGSPKQNLILSRDGKWAFGALNDGVVVVWDVLSGKIVEKIRGDNAEVLLDFTVADSGDMLSVITLTTTQEDVVSGRFFVSVWEKP